MPSDVEFEARTLLERVSLAAREPIYSAAIAWLLEERSPLPLAGRLSILGTLCGLDLSDAHSVRATTEWQDVDILFTVGRPTGELFVAVENKIKADQGPNQLAVYDERLAKLPGSVRKVLLTLTGAEGRSGVEWRSTSYRALLDAIRRQAGAGHIQVAELSQALGRLVAICEAARENTFGVAGAAFGDTSTADLGHAGEFVREMRLSKVVQRTWMHGLAAGLGVHPPWLMSVEETRGQALLNLGATPVGLPGCVVGLQLQGRSLKAFCAPDPYPRVATAEQHDLVEAGLESLRSTLRLPLSAAPSGRKPRGFRSFKVAALPEGRVPREWCEVIRPIFVRLSSTMRSVGASGGELPSLGQDTS